MPQSLYIITESGDHSASKIGISRDPVARRGQLQTGNPRHLQIQHIVAMPKGMRARTVEAEIHRHFDDAKINAGGDEWFSVHPDRAFFVARQIAGIASPPWWARFGFWPTFAVGFGGVAALALVWLWG